MVIERGASHVNCARPEYRRPFVMLRLSVREPEVHVRRGKVGEHQGLPIAIP
jgi:hypothetical protein